MFFQFACTVQKLGQWQKASSVNLMRSVYGVYGERLLRTSCTKHCINLEVLQVNSQPQLCDLRCPCWTGVYDSLDTSPDRSHQTAEISHNGFTTPLEETLARPRQTWTCTAEKISFFSTLASTIAIELAWNRGYGDAPSWGLPPMMMIMMVVVCWNSI